MLAPPSPAPLPAAPRALPAQTSNCRSCLRAIADLLAALPAEGRPGRPSGAAPHGLSSPCQGWSRQWVGAGATAWRCRAPRRRYRAAVGAESLHGAEHGDKCSLSSAVIFTNRPVPVLKHLGTTSSAPPAAGEGPVDVCPSQEELLLRVGAAGARAQARAPGLSRWALGARCAPQNPAEAPSLGAQPRSRPGGRSCTESLEGQQGGTGTGPSPPGGQRSSTGWAEASAGIPAGAGRPSWLCSRVRWRDQVFLHVAIPAARIVAEVRAVVCLPRMVWGRVFPVLDVL